MPALNALPCLSAKDCKKESCLLVIMATIDNRVEADPGISDYARRVASRMARLAACTSTYVAGHGAAPGDPPPVEDVVLGDPDVHRPIMAKGFAHGAHFASPPASADDMEGGDFGSFMRGIKHGFDVSNAKVSRALGLGDATGLAGRGVGGGAVFADPERNKARDRFRGVASMSSMISSRAQPPGGFTSLQEGKQPSRRRPMLGSMDAPPAPRSGLATRSEEAARRSRLNLSDLRPATRGPQFDTKNEGWNGHVVGGLSGTQGVGAGVGSGLCGGGVGGDLPGPAPGEGAAAVNELPALPAEPRKRRNPDLEHVLMAKWGAPLDYWRPNGSQQALENIVEHGEGPENGTIRYNFYDGELPVEPIAAMAGKTGSKRKRVVKG